MKKKDFILLIFIALVFILLIKFIKIQTVEEHRRDLSSDTDFVSKNLSVTLSINCSAIFDNLDKLDKNLNNPDYIPKNGIILDTTAVNIHDGDTAFDVLSRAASRNNIPIEYEGSNTSSFGSVYVTGINHICEFSCGELSGWIFLVNGKIYDFGCDKYKVSDGDTIEWIYTCDLGRDIVNHNQST